MQLKAEGRQQATAESKENKSAIFAEQNIVTASRANFNAIITASTQRPIILAFWAPWCQPCLQLHPILEQFCQSRPPGTILLAKVNLDELQQIAQQFQIRSIPSILLLIGKRHIDGFTGLLPKPEVLKFLQRAIARGRELLGQPKQNETSSQVQQAQHAMQAGDYGLAMSLFQQELAGNTENIDALAGLARCYLAYGEATKAQQLLLPLTEKQRTQPPILQLAADIELQLEPLTSEQQLPELQQQYQQHPEDNELGLTLAKTLIKQGNKTAAINVLLASLGRDPQNKPAHKYLLTILRSLTNTDPIALTTRKKLSSILFS